MRLDFLDMKEEDLTNFSQEASIQVAMCFPGSRGRVDRLHLGLHALLPFRGRLQTLGATAISMLLLRRLRG